MNITATFLDFMMREKVKICTGVVFLLVIMGFIAQCESLNTEEGNFLGGYNMVDFEAPEYFDTSIEFEEGLDSDEEDQEDEEGDENDEDSDLTEYEDFNQFETHDLLYDEAKLQFKDWEEKMLLELKFGVDKEYLAQQLTCGKFFISFIL